MVLRHAVVGLAGLAALLIVPVAAGAASSKPIPKAVAVTLPAYSPDPLAVLVTIRGGKKTSRHVAVSLALVPVAGGSRIALPRGTIKKLKRRAKFRLRLGVSEHAAAGRYVLVACIGKACARSAAFALRPPTPALDRLAADLAAGKITAGEAALYEFLAATKSPKLPLAYRTSTPGPDTLGTIAMEHWGQLSDADKGAILPYLLPPRYRDSHWDPGAHVPAARLQRGIFDSCTGRPAAAAGTWTAVPATHGVVWYSNPADETLAGNLAGELDVIWNKLVGTDGFTAPASDASCDPSGDGRLDVYIVGPSAFVDENGVVIPGLIGGQTNGNSCGKTAAVIMLNDTRSPEGASWSLAHEFFHAEEFASNAFCKQPSGWIEGAADWAKDEVYPRNPDPHGHVLWSRNPLAPLQDQSYDGWPFWYWLAHDKGVSAVGKVLTTIGASGFDTAVRTAPGGDFTQWFGLFGEALWNADPIGQSGITVDKSFSALDGYGEPAMATDLTLKQGGSKAGPNPDTYRTNAAVGSLGMRYLDLTVDNGVGQLEIANGYADTADVAVRLLADTDTGWQDIDLTHLPNKTFCFSHSGEKISKGVLVIANAGLAANAKNVDLIAHEVCDPEVTFSGTADCLNDCLAMSQVQEHWDWSGSAKLKASPENGLPGVTFREYDLDSGSMTVHLHTVVHEPDGTDCVGDGTKVVVLGSGGASGGDFVQITLMDQPPTYQINASLGALETIQLSYTGCDQGPPLPLDGINYLTSGDTPRARDPAATTISDSYDPPVVAGTTDLTRHYQYTLTGM
jgi:hypothetical protein